MFNQGKGNFFLDSFLKISTKPMSFFSVKTIKIEGQQREGAYTEKGHHVKKLFLKFQF